MNVNVTDHADSAYSLAEQRAAQYFVSLHMQFKEKLMYLLSLKIFNYGKTSYSSPLMVVIFL